MLDNMDVTIAYSTRKQTPKNYKDYFNKNIKLVKVNNFTRNINPIKDFKAIFEVRKIVKKENADIIHMHSSKAGAIGRIAISSKKAKLFYTPHGYAFCKKDDSIFRRKIYMIIEKILANKKCLTIACSKGEYEDSLKITKNSTFIDNGIDIEDIEKYIKKDQEKILDNKNLKICTVGRIGNQKNPELFNKIAERFPDTSFTWIGDGNLKDTLVSPNIKITGWFKRDEAIKELYKNDIFILTSLWEGLPITLLEAMYLKKICIVSNVSGNRDVIKNGMNGFICDTEDEYCNIIENIQKWKINTGKIQNEAKKTIITNHNIDRIAEKYFEIYCKGDDEY